MNDQTSLVSFDKDKERVLKAILTGGDVECPFHVEGLRCCTLDPRSITLCDGKLVQEGVKCTKEAA